MAWSDLFRQARDVAQGLGSWFSKPSSPTPRYRPASTPRYYPAPPPVPQDYRSGSPPIQNINVLYQRVVDLGNRAQNPSVSPWQGQSQMQEALQNTQEMLQYPMPPDMRRQIEESRGSIQKWLQDFQQAQQPPPVGPTKPPPPGQPTPGAGTSLPRPEEEEEEEEEEAIQERPISDVQNWIEDYPEESLDEVTVTKTADSSNVYSFVWVSDEHTITDDGGISINLYGGRSSEMGTLIVTFKDWAPGTSQKERPNYPGSTYAYAGVSRQKYEAFAGEGGGGVAVWDYLRIRGTQSGHQHAYRLISVTGEYVPRMATPYGFRRRRHKVLKITEAAYGGEDVPYVKEMMESTLQPGPLTRFGITLPPEEPRGETGTSWSRTAYRTRRRQGGYPNRGTPNRGTPNRGRP